jgi:signal peptidase II
LKQAVLWGRCVTFFSLAAGGCAVDLATKTWMFDPTHQVPDAGHAPWWLWKDVFGFQTSLNEGALFGMGQGLWPLFAGLSIAAAGGILVWLFWFGAARDWLLTVALGCVTAGIFGNLYDRLGLPGLIWPAGDPVHVPGSAVHAVRDFIHVMIGVWPWPTFNLADSSLVCGAALLVWHAFFTKGQGEPQKTEPSQAAAAGQ